MSTRERVLWLIVGVEVVLGATAAWMQNWWASATMASFAVAALFTLRTVRNANNPRVNPLLAFGATLVVLAILGLALPLGSSAPPQPLSYGILTGGILVVCVAGVAVALRRSRQP